MSRLRRVLHKESGHTLEGKNLKGGLAQLAGARSLEHLHGQLGKT
jgi:hypothetical protein